MKFRRYLGSAIAVISLVFAGTAAASASANAATRVGGVDVERVCQFDFDYHAYVASWSAWGWRCNPVPNNQYYKVLDQNADMNKACRLQYGGTSWANAADAGNPYSWSCYI